VRLALRLSASAAALALATAGCGNGHSASTSTSTGLFNGAAFPLGVYAPGFTLEDQLGRHVSLSALRGEVIVLAFVSTDCRACVLAAQQVRGALNELAEAPTYGRGTAVPAMRVLFVSTDPRTDTRVRVRRFLAETSLAGRASYLTGTEKQLRAVWRAYRVTPLSTGRKASEAATTVLLIGRSGTERVAFGLEQLTPESLSHDIRLLRDGRSTAG
jgi:cytochrome oxidase Cu insertion factor (SCO1/SenC/PrrC family)